MLQEFDCVIVVGFEVLYFGEQWRQYFGDELFFGVGWEVGYLFGVGYVVLEVVGCELFCMEVGQFEFFYFFGVFCGCEVGEVYGWFFVFGVCELQQWVFFGIFLLCLVFGCRVYLWCVGLVDCF